MQKTIIVSIHDVSPKYKKEIIEILGKLKKINLKKKELHIVLDFQRRHKIEKDIKFLNLIKKEISNGSLPAFHGIIHYKNHGTVLNSIIYGKEHGFISEFDEIKNSEFKKIISKGKLDYKRIMGFYPKLFIPARWESPKESIEICKKENIPYYENKIKMVNTKNNSEILSPICNFDFGNNKIINKLSRLLARLSIFIAFITHRPLRYAIHPNDINNGNVNFEIRLLKKLLKRGWKPKTSQEFWNEFNKK